MGIRLFDLFRSAEQKADGYSRELQAARVRAAHQRSYFAPALFSLVPVETDLIGSMAVDSHWRLYYNDDWVAAHSVEQNASLLIHEVSHLVRDHQERRKAAGIMDERRWNTAGDCEINDDLHAEGLPLPGDPPMPGTYGLQSGDTAESYYKQLPASPPAERRAAVVDEQQPSLDCGSGAHGERRFWELPADEGADDGVPGVDQIKAELVRREVARRIGEKSLFAGDVPLPGGAGPARPLRRRLTTWPRSVTQCGDRATARSADTTGHTGDRIAGRPATAIHHGQLLPAAAAAGILD